MKMVKSLMLGTAAGLVALTGAQAADLPVKAKAVEYVKVCSLYGAGFYYIPGTDTCIRIGGQLRLDVAFNGGIYDNPFWRGGAGASNAYTRDWYTPRTRVNLFVDTRTQTEYGVLRTLADVKFDWTGGTTGIAGGATEVDYAFIQFAGFTIGKAVSMFDPQWALGKPTISSGFNAGSNNATGLPLLAYTATFGNGVSGTISLESARPYRDAGLINTSIAWAAPFAGSTLASSGGPSAFTGNQQLGDHVPDIVGNLRLDQAWGSLHFGAAAHEVHGSYYNSITGGLGNSDFGRPNATWGWAVTGAFELKNLPTGVGDSFKIDATFANGAAKYVFGGTVDAAGGGQYAIVNGLGAQFGYVLDGVYTGTSSANGTGITKSDAWQVSAYYEHYWNPAWRTSLFGNYSQISYGAGSAAMLAAFNAGSMFVTGTALTGDFSFSTWQIGTRTAWTPVKNLTIAGEVLYTRISSGLAGTVGIASAPGYGSPTTFTIKDQNRFNGALQVSRSF